MKRKLCPSACTEHHAKAAVQCEVAIGRIQVRIVTRCRTDPRTFSRPALPKSAGLEDQWERVILTLPSLSRVSMYRLDSRENRGLHSGLVDIFLLPKLITLFLSVLVVLSVYIHF